MKQIKHFQQYLLQVRSSIKQSLIESIVLIRFCFVYSSARVKVSRLSQIDLYASSYRSMHASRISPPCLMKISRRRPTRVGGSKRHVSLFRAHRSVHLCIETFPRTDANSTGGGYRRTKTKILIKSSSIRVLSLSIIYRLGVQITKAGLDDFN